MTFKDSPISKSLIYERVELGFGVYYKLEKFFIIEVDEGTHFNRDKLNTLINSLRKEYGTHRTLAYIANRVHSYSIDPILWTYFDEDDSLLVAAAIVSYRDSTYMNANIEKQMASIPLKRAHSLKEAINWVQQFNELN